MGCDFRKGPDGSIAIACTRGRRTPQCSVCRARPGTQLCDGPGTTAGKTYDKPLCRTCAHRGGPNVDFCPEHRPESAR